VQQAQAKLAGGQALSIDDLANLTKETVMTTPPDVKQMGLLLKPFAERHLSEDDKAAMKAKLIDRDQAVRDWNGLIAEAQGLLEAGDPTSPGAQDMARRWTAMVKKFTTGNPDITAKSQAVWDDAMEDPAVAGKMALNRKIFAFVNQAIAHLKAQEK
jgi:hypothetical protein